MIMMREKDDDDVDGNAACSSLKTALALTLGKVASKCRKIMRTFRVMRQTTKKRQNRRLSMISLTMAHALPFRGVKAATFWTGPWFCNDVLSGLSMLLFIVVISADDDSILISLTVHVTTTAITLEIIPETTTRRYPDSFQGYSLTSGSSSKCLSPSSVRLINGIVHASTIGPDSKAATFMT